MNHAKIITTLIFLFLLSRLECQEYHHQLHDDTRNEFQMGLKLGVNVSNVYDDEGNQIMPDPKFGFAGGGYMSFPISRYFGIQPEAMYSQKGFLARGTILSMDYSYTLTTDYIDIPLHFQYKPAPALTILLGPQYSVLMDRSDQFGSGSITAKEREEIKNNYVRKNVFSASTGLDAKVEHLIMSIRACWDLQSNNGAGTGMSPDYKNIWLQGTVGYVF
ncbi:MAG TPA: porin family protein [Bacteroidia bacterium]|nr:porin family protein [Bacteroidia bacterium]